MKARIVRLDVPYKERHLYWRGDNSVFVTTCQDGSVILDGEVMTLAQATSKLLKERGVPSSFFWEL